MSKLFQSPCLPKEMTHSKDAVFRNGDNRVPVAGTLQYRWGNSMKDTMPNAQPVVAEGKFGGQHPSNENSSPFYMTGGTKRSHISIKE